MRQRLEGMLGYLHIYNYEELHNGDVIMFSLDTPSLSDYELRLLLDVFRRVDINATCGDDRMPNINLVCRPKLDNSKESVTLK